VDLQSATDEGNETTNPIKVAELQLYDASNDAYATVQAGDGSYIFSSFSGDTILSINDTGQLTLQKTPLISGNLNTNELTQTRDLEFPNEDGTISLQFIEKTASFTAKNGIPYSANGTITVTDPTPIANKGYIVHVIGGTSTIGGVGYTTGALVYRYYDGSSWISTNMNNAITIDATPTDGSSNAVSSNGVFDALAIRPKFIWKLATPTTTLTGTNSETLMASVLIPANTLSANDILRVVTLMVKKTTATNTTSVRLKYNTSNTLSGATLLSTSQISTTNNFGNINRDFLINGGNISGLLNTAIAFTDKIQSTVGFSTNSINVANDVYLLVSLQNNTISDVSNIECIEIMN
jgi:hypothetical protein